MSTQPQLGRLPPARSAAKRALDITAALSVLIVASPILILVGLAILIRMGRPVLYRQERPGLEERPFTLIKFRTMSAAVDAAGHVRPDAERLTPLGRFLRRSSLDELPELLNILRGDMSFVGPRPLLMKYLPYYSEREQARHGVRPGLTGWAQTHGRNELGWDERLKLDVWYVTNWTLTLDFKILWRTVALVLRQEGVVEAPGTELQDLDAERSGGEPRRRSRPGAQAR